MPEDHEPAFLVIRAGALLRAGNLVSFGASRGGHVSRESGAALRALLGGACLVALLASCSRDLDQLYADAEQVSTDDAGDADAGRVSMDDPGDAGDARDTRLPGAVAYAAYDDHEACAACFASQCAEQSP